MGADHRLRCCAALAAALAGLLADEPAAAAQEQRPSLLGLSLEELSNIQITSVSRRAERLSDVPASVFVITGEDIRRAGATSLPEALRLAPNLHVAQVYNGGYSISPRGFNGNAANKLLVLIGGRSVYTPLFSGVFWDVQDVMLEDVERIEVISGPGGTLWGTNAVNGVINVIMRPTAETQGWLASAGAGSREAGAAVRYGGRLANGGSWRAYAKHVHQRHHETASGALVDDERQHTQMGFRAEWQAGGDRFTVFGNAYDGRREQPLPGSLSTGASLALDAISTSGANLVARWRRSLDASANVLVQACYDRTNRVNPPTFSEQLDIADLLVQHTLRPMEGHELVWGAEYRYAVDEVTNSPYVAFLPPKVSHDWVSLFAQDELTLTERLRFTVGARVEHNDYTGTEFLPNVRLAWKWRDNHLLWGALSHTVRAPSRLDHDTYVPGQPPFLLAGGPGVRSETADVAELGYRGQPTRSTLLSATLFHARYDDLRTQEMAPNRTFAYFANGMKGSTQGVELWGSWQPTAQWRLNAGFSRLWQELSLKAGSTDVASLRATEGANPKRRWLLRSSWDLPRNVELDATLRYVSELSSPAVPAYTALDLRLGWRPRADLELWLVGQNLDGGHGEFTGVATRSELEPSVYLGLVSRF